MTSCSVSFKRCVCSFWTFVIVSSISVIASSSCFENQSFKMDVTDPSDANTLILPNEMVRNKIAITIIFIKCDFFIRVCFKRLSGKGLPPLFGKRLGQMCSVKRKRKIPAPSSFVNLRYQIYHPYHLLLLVQGQQLLLR